MQNALYQAAVNNFRSQAAAARRQPPKSGVAQHRLSNSVLDIDTDPCTGMVEHTETQAY